MVNKDAVKECAVDSCDKMNKDEKRRSFWICFIFTFIFFILGLTTLTRVDDISTLSFVFTLWLLQLVLLLFFAYYALMVQPCHVMIYILFFLTLFFSTLWLMELTNNLLVSNLSLVAALIFTLTLIYLTTPNFQVLGIVSVLIWLFLFFYINRVHGSKI